MANATPKTARTAAAAPAAPEAPTGSTAAVFTAQTEQAIAAAKQAFDQIATRSREAMEQGLKSVSRITEMNRGNVDALLESSRAASGGMQAMAADFAAFSKLSFERTASAAQTIGRARTAPELMQLQSEFARNEFSTAISEYSRLTQHMFQTLSAMFEPLQKHAITAAQIRDLLAED